jgi:hypothetical protein
MQATKRGRIALLAAAALALGAAFAMADPREWNDDDWCRNQWNDDDRAHACEVRTLTLAKLPRILHVEPGPNGGVEVAAGKAGQVFVRARVEAWGRTQAEAEATLKQIRVVQGEGGLSAEGPAQDKSKWLSGWSVSFRVEAPAATALELSSTNGPVGVYDMTGRMLLETENGPLAITRCSGDIAARTQNGPLAVTLAGTHWVGRGLSARAVNGPVALDVPRNYDAELEYGTIHGPWSGPRPALAEAGYVHVKLGKGGAPISVTTQNGPFAMDHGD